MAASPLGHNRGAAGVGDGGDGQSPALGMHWPLDLIVATLISRLLVTVACWLTQRLCGPLSPPGEEAQDIKNGCLKRNNVDFSGIRPHILKSCHAFHSTAAAKMILYRAESGLFRATHITGSHVKYLLIFLLVLAIFVISVTLGAQNDQQVTFNYLLAQGEFRISTLLAVLFAAGFAIGWLICGLFWLRVRVSLARAERKIKRLEHQIAPSARRLSTQACLR